MHVTSLHAKLRVRMRTLHTRMHMHAIPHTFRVHAHTPLTPHTCMQVVEGRWIATVLLVLFWVPHAGSVCTGLCGSDLFGTCDTGNTVISLNTPYV